VGGLDFLSTDLKSFIDVKVENRKKRYWLSDSWFYRLYDYLVLSFSIHYIKSGVLSTKNDKVGPETGPREVILQADRTTIFMPCYR